MRTAEDDLWHPVPFVAPVRRVVSLVPSLTEALAASHPERLVGATEWCTHPADLDVPRVRGTKNPDLAAIAALAPDLVVANKEENRELDVRRLRERGVPVWVTDIEAVPQALDSMDRLFEVALEWEQPDWLRQARALWSGPVPAQQVSVAVPIWRDPWMVVGRDTYTGDLLARAGLTNAFADAEERYPHTEVAAIEASGAHTVLLPDEPYAFGPDDGPRDLQPALRTSGRTPHHLVRPGHGPGPRGAGPAVHPIGDPSRPLTTGPVGTAATEPEQVGVAQHGPFCAMMASPAQGGRMTKHIVVGTDGSETARQATRTAANLAAALGAELHVVCAYDKLEVSTITEGGDNFRYASDEEAQAIASGEATRVSTDPTLKVHAEVAQGRPAEVLLQRAEALEADLIVVGNKRVQGLARILGSIASSVASKATCDVYIAHTH